MIDIVLLIEDTNNNNKLCIPNRYILVNCFCYLRYDVQLVASGCLFLVNQSFVSIFVNDIFDVDDPCRMVIMVVLRSFN